MKKYLQLMRVKHYIKNLFVFAALFCTGQLLNWEKLGKTAIAFAAFSLITSAIYIFNDIRDRESDMLHPEKRSRPIASGEVSVKNAYILAGVLTVIGLACNCVLLVLEPFRIVPTLLLIMYILINVSYSHGWKSVPLLDLSFLAAGYMIRVVYGALVLDITMPNWMFLALFAQAFCLALGKRRNDLTRLGVSDDDKLPASAGDYPVKFLNHCMMMCMTLTNVFFALWVLDEPTRVLFRNARFYSRYMIITIPVLLLVTLKYDLTIEHAPDGDPVEVLLHDKVLLAMYAALIVIMGVVLYI